jgi:hypothetical protein
MHLQDAVIVRIVGNLKSRDSFTLYLLLYGSRILNFLTRILYVYYPSFSRFFPREPFLVDLLPLCYIHWTRPIPTFLPTALCKLAINV